MARRILLADDSVTAQNMGRRILTDAGYEVVTVNNGSAALKKIAESKPDLIVLDVYMPGYGGLEVCQRVKESAETKRIPVLLTVGKLEPFKAEEARRVGADSFIIKPFEATELLTVLARLEDKIVAQPQPQKTGRFAKALAAMQQSDTGDRFGDQETGWKSRLTIPGPNAKSKTEDEALEAAAPPASRGLEPYSSDPRDSRPTGNAEQRNAEQSESVKPVEPSREFERPIPAGLPADITPEEIAAITAAAASMDGRPEAAAAGSDRVAEEAVAIVVPVEETASQVAAETTSANADQSEASAAASTSVPELVQETQVEAPAEVQAVAAEGVPEAVASIEAAKVEDQPVASDLPPVETSSVSIASEAQISEAEKRAGNDAEVMAAIDSLAPSNGQAIASLSSLPQGSNGSGHQAHGSANHGSANHGSAVAAEAALTSPRWIAEAIAVAVEESKLALDQEMEQARIRVAQSAEIASAAPVESPSPVAVIESAVMESAVVEIAMVESATTEAATVEAATMEPVESPAVAAVASDAESVSAVSTEFVPAPADTGSVVIESSTEPTSITESATAQSATAQSPILLSPTVQEAAAAADAPGAIREESAYAAAAGFAAEAASTTIAAPSSADNRSIAPPEVEPGREAELAAAWQNWKQIRESLASPAPGPPVSEVPAAEVPVNEAQVAEVPVPEAPVSAANSTEDVASPVQPAELAAEVEAAASEAPEESTAIASIVDTMLAELRPKLVAEIAKKMSSEKKEKEKKKKR